MISSKSELLSRLKDADSKLLSFQRPHVRELLKIMINNGSYLEASETGAGKTYTTIAVCKIIDFKALVVCPKSVIPAWEEASRHFDYRMLDCLTYEKLKLGGTDWFEEIQTEKEWLKEYAYKNINPDDTVIIFDEGHRCKNPDTLNSRLLEQAVNQEFFTIVISATIADNPGDLGVTGYSLGLFDSMDDYYDWAVSYGCEYKSGKMVFTAPEEQQKEFMEKLHHEIFPSKGAKMKAILPDNFVMAEPIGMENSSKIQEAYDEMNEQLELLKEKSKDDKKSYFTTLLRGRQKVEILKVPTIVEMTSDLLENKSSVAVFVNFNQTIDAIGKKLKKLGIDYAIIRGGQSRGERENERMKFQNNEVGVILCNSNAGGVGISLHDLNGSFPRVSLISPTFSAPALKQVIGRIARAEGKSKCIQKLIFCEGTIEDKIRKSVARKLKNMSMLNDGDLRGAYNL